MAAYHKDPEFALGWSDFFLGPPDPRNLRKLFFVAFVAAIIIGAGCILL